ncbi:MAG: AbrB/MazE/SpoVT family DNA-binding domain-containing protein [Minicystis sp.]
MKKWVRGGGPAGFSKRDVGVVEEVASAYSSTMATLTMSRRGQLTVPPALRENLELRPGCQVDVCIDNEGPLVVTPVLYEPEDLIPSTTTDGCPPLILASSD